MLRPAITDYEIHVIQAPMSAFAHAAKVRHHTDSVTVTLRAGDLCGWGEGAPRDYVTGEDVDAALASLCGFPFEELNTNIDWGHFENGVRDIAGMPWSRWLGPAASAALELSCFDLLCRLHGRSILDALTSLGLHAPEERSVGFGVSTVISMHQDPIAVLSDMKPGSIHCLKIKVPASPSAAADQVRALLPLVPSGIPVCVDVNGAWDLDAMLPDMPTFARLSWIEEPLSPRRWGDLAELRREYGVRFMLDESAIELQDLHDAVEAGACDAVNIRVSKCGGIVAALSMLRACHEHGLRYQLGVHPGEIGPLWAAGRALAACSPTPLAIEAGRQDEWLAEPLTDPVFRVDRTTNRAHILEGPGLAVIPSKALRHHMQLVAGRSVS